MNRSHHGLFAALILFAVSLPSSLWAQSLVDLSVDLRDAPRKLLHATEHIAVHPGPMTLAYPKWIRNEHVPNPLSQQVGLTVTSANRADSPAKPITWRRDPLDLYLYHLVIPEGVHTIEVKTDFITSDSDGSDSASSDANLAVLDWNTVVLYPYDGPTTRVADIEFSPQVILPDGWRYATSLRPRDAGNQAATPGGVAFEAVSLETLVDSPVISGQYFREIPLAQDVSPRHFLDIVADQPDDLDVPQDRIDDLSTGIRQASYLFRSHHYRDYRFLITLSNHITVAEVDHHQSLDNRRPAGFFHDEKRRALGANYTIHDFIHAWNGKYRRPEGLATPNFQVPPDTTGMWVYEGLTNYLADVITARSHISTSSAFLDALALRAAYYNNRPGRQWRDLNDADVMSYPLWTNGDSAYDSLRRNGFESYGEGALIWLDVDTTIRNKTNGRKSLNDFAVLFYGRGGNTGPKVVPYSFDDIVACLNQVAPNNWAEFLDQRLHSLAKDAPLGGITGGGYRLVYRESPNASFVDSLAMTVGPDGAISDIIVGGIADHAGFGPGMKILAVNDAPYSTKALQDAIDAARTNSAAIQFKVDNTGVASTLSINYHGGQRRPALERIPGTPDRLNEILKPMTM